jgi:Fe-Mn family superoxide dismutase
MAYTEKSFNIPNNTGLSEEQISVHLGLYAGYVKNTNALLDKIATWPAEGDMIALSELQRRLGFEFDGMRLHEFYFSQLSEGSKALDENSKFGQLISKQYGSLEAYQADLKRIGSTRGIGWVITYYDAVSDMLINSWVSDHELGHLAGLPIILVIDLWEHAFFIDYRPATKGDYIDTYIKAINWEIIANRL